MGKMRWLGLAALVGTLSCAWVPLEPGAKGVDVRVTSGVTGCERIGKTNTRTAERIGPFPRRQSKIEEELANLARNEAVRMGGNAVAPLSKMLGGEQRFGIYRCS